MSLRNTVYRSILTLIACSGFWAIPSSLAAESAPDPLDPCPLKIRLIGPRELPTGAVATYLIKLENKSSCQLSGASLKDYFPDASRFRRSDPVPTKVQKHPLPKGPELTWEGLELDPGQVALFEIGMQVRGSANVGRKRICVLHPVLIGGKTCKNYQIWTMP
ncbi:MAG: hypothetical protein A2X94_15360 [Bdellovibrionales bacterium GWB1_55_8]|nr:MAG: hypothetical protein A2X94_15360 [Bdellovibrionales bacterium GWB1_55_8]